MFRENARKSARQVADMLTAHPDIANNEIWTKTSIIQPFLESLGYDTTQPAQVKLEVTTELGGKIDYVLIGETSAPIAVEAKKAGLKLSDKETNQLRSYFTFSEAVAAILTNGVDYWLFTDLHKKNVMDAEPYRKVNIRSVSENDLRHLESLSRIRISQELVHEQAQREQYQALINTIVSQELDAPSSEFLRMVGKKAEIKPLNKANLGMLEPLVIAAIRNVRGRSTPKALEPTPSSSSPSTVQDQPPPAEPTAGVKAALTKANFQGATLFRSPLPVANYKEVLVEVVKTLQLMHPWSFADRVNKAPFRKPTRKWQYISTTKEDLHPKASKELVGEHWVDTNLDADGKEKRARLFLEAFGHEPADLEIQTKTD